jgi:hypothetical protein
VDKPLDLDELCDAIEQILKERYSMSPGRL